jgi:hypothetical protein
MTPQLGRAGGGLDPHDQILEINSNSYCQQNVYFAGIYKKQNSCDAEQALQTVQRPLAAELSMCVSCPEKSIPSSGRRRLRLMDLLVIRFFIKLRV